MKNQLGSYNTLSSNPGWMAWIIEMVAWLQTFSSWFTQAQWCEELVGTLTNDHASGGPLDQFEMDVGQSFPDLHIRRQEVVDAWRTYQRAWPWDKGATAKAYGKKAAEFATALQATMAEYAGIPIGGIGEWLKKWWPYALAAGILATGVGLAYWKFRK